MQRCCYSDKPEHTSPLTRFRALAQGARAAPSPEDPNPERQRHGDCSQSRKKCEECQPENLAEQSRSGTDQGRCRGNKTDMDELEELKADPRFQNLLGKAETHEWEFRPKEAERLEAEGKLQGLLI